MNRTYFASTVLLLLAGQLHAATTATEPSVNPVSSINPVETINCTYQIPPQTTNIDLNILKQWAEYAASQSFHLSYQTLDQDINQLKHCFTEQGFTSFQNALETSGNMTAIKNQKLNVNGVKNGDLSVEVLKDGRWRVSVPLQVVYQNDQEKLTQELTVILLVERKPAGQFGIVQINAQTNNLKDNTPATSNPVTPATQSESTTMPTQTDTHAVSGSTNTTQPLPESSSVSPSATTPANSTTTPTTNMSNNAQTPESQNNNITSGTQDNKMP